MSQREPADAIRLIPAETRQREYYQIFILSSLALAGLAGFALGIHIPLGRLLGWQSEARRPDIIQVHGQVQLLGFAGLFVLGMSLRLIPRFARTTLRFEGLVLPIWGLIVGSLAMKAFIMVWLPDQAHSALAIGTQFTLLLAAAGYLLVVHGSLLIDQQRVEATGWFFLVGSTFFFLQAALGTFIAMEEAADETRVFSYVPNMALLYLQLGGFLIAYIGGVATRALPTMSGLPRPETGAKRAAVALAASVLLLASPLVLIEYRSYSTTLARLSDIGLVAFGLTLVAIVWLTGVLRQYANRVRPASQPHMRLVRLALAWMAVAGAMAVYFGSKALIDGSLPLFFQLDAFRHTLALGAVTTLIFGMALLIVPEFAGERQFEHHQARLSSVLMVLIAAATVLRILPALLGTDVSADTRSWMMAVAGVLGEAALLYFAWNFFRLVRSSRRAVRPLAGAGSQTPEGPRPLPS